MKRIAVDLAKSVYQVAESVRAGVVSQHRRLSREAFGRYIQEQAEPVEWLMEACGTAQHERDLVEGFGEVYLPFALARKYPAAPREWGWQYVFPAAQRSTDPRSGVQRRHHVDEKRV